MGDDGEVVDTQFYDATDSREVAVKYLGLYTSKILVEDSSSGQIVEKDNEYTLADYALVKAAVDDNDIKVDKPMIALNITANGIGVKDSQAAVIPMEELPEDANLDDFEPIPFFTATKGSIQVSSASTDKILLHTENVLPSISKLVIQQPKDSNGNSVNDYFQYSKMPAVEGKHVMKLRFEIIN